MREEQGRYEEEGWRVRKDGTFFWASVVIDPIHEDGKLVGFAKITRDITERREAQLKLEQMQQQLAESQKLDALGQLTGGVAHDFNNLLMIISGSLHTLKKGVDDDPRLQRALSAIEAATKRGAALTSQLLTFARRQSVNPQAIDVTERINAVREVLDTGVGGAVTLQFDIDRTRLAGHGRCRRVRDRAGQSRHQRARRHAGRRHHHGCSAITRAQRRSQCRRICRDLRRGYRRRHRSRRSEQDIRSVLHDQADRQGHRTWVFRRFTASRIRPAARSRSPANSAREPTITILLPRKDVRLAVDDSECRRSRRKRHGPAGRRQSGRRDVSTSLLEQLGYTVRRVANAEAALREIEHDGIDLVFSDIVMPGKMDGLSFARHLQGHPAQLPILLATGYSDAAVNVRGDFPILRKPYEIHQFSQAIAKLPK